MHSTGIVSYCVYVLQKNKEDIYAKAYTSMYCKGLWLHEHSKCLQRTWKNELANLHVVFWDICSF